MEEGIINRVANSELVTIDLTDYVPTTPISEFDIKNLLFNGIVLKEKDFRKSLKEFDFSIYKNTIVALHCSADAIVPMWAFMLITSYLQTANTDVYYGKKKDVFLKLFTENIDNINSLDYENKKVIVKGCGQIQLNECLYIAITKKLQNKVRSLMFGEACSAVPVFKKSKI